MSHFDSVVARRAGASRNSATPRSARRRGRTASPPSAPTRCRRYGFQFHPEVDDTRARRRDDRQLRARHLRLPPVVDDGALPRGAGGARAARRSATGRSSCSPPAASTRRSRPGCSRLAIGPERLHLLHVDNGLMRKDESRAVRRDAPRPRPRPATCTSSTPATRFLARARRASSSRSGSGRSSATRSSRCSSARRGGCGIEGHLLGPGHDLPRHDRDRRHEARRHHQDPPQPRADHRGDDRGRHASSSRSPSSTRWRCASSASSSASRATSSGATRSRGPASACGCSARRAWRTARTSREIEPPVASVAARVRPRRRSRCRSARSA